MYIKEEISLEEKLQILSDAAKYDVACTSSGVDRRERKEVWAIPGLAVFVTVSPQTAAVSPF